MELGLLSNMLVNSQPYWQAYVPPLFSAIAGDRTNVRIVAPPPVAWKRRTAWKSVRSQIKACDTLFWLQLSARPAAPNPLGVAKQIGRSSRELHHRPVEARGDQDRGGGDDWSVSIHASSLIWKPRRNSSGVSRWGSSSGCRMPPTRIFFTRATRESLTSPSIWAAATRLCIRRSLNIAKRAALSISIPIGSCSERNSGGRRPAPSISSLRRARSSTPRRRLRSVRSRRDISRGWQRERGCSALYLRAASTRRFCRPTPCAKCRSTVRIWLNVSIEIDKIQTINAPLTPPRPWCANIIRGGRRGQQIYSYLQHGGPLDLHLMPQARNRADIAAALTS